MTSLREKLAHEMSGRKDVVKECMLTPNEMRDRILRRERDFISGFQACDEYVVKKLVEALERIVRFNPSYDYTFENARTIARAALEDVRKG